MKLFNFFTLPQLSNEKVMLTFISFIAVIFTLFLTLIASLEGNSIALWSRFFSYFIDAFLLFFSYTIAQFNQKRSQAIFDFGLEKLESFSGILLSFMVMFYTLIILFAAYYRIMNPTPLIENHFGLYLYLIFIGKDIGLFYKLSQYTRTQRSPLISSQKRYYLLSLCANVLVLLPLFLATIMPSHSTIPMTIDILSALGLCFFTAYLSYGVGKRAALDLIDRALYGLVEGDTLQTLGQGTVLNNVLPEYATVRLVMINRREEWINKKTSKISYASTDANLGAPGALASLYLDLREKADSHSNPTLHSASKQQKMTVDLQDIPNLHFEYYDNRTPEGRAAIMRHLKRTVIWNVGIMQFGRKGVYALMKWIWL